MTVTRSSSYESEEGKNSINLGKVNEEDDDNDCGLFEYERNERLVDPDDGDENDPPSDCGLSEDEPDNAIQSTSILSQDMSTKWAGHRLQLAPTLFVRRLDDCHWVVCNPVEEVRIAVLDEEAYAVLAAFQEPISCEEVPELRGPLSTSLLSIFVHLSFLHDLDQPLVRPTERRQGSTLAAWLHMTNACNLRCQYCYVAKSQEHMLPETARESVDAIIRSAVRHGYKRVHVKYAGGEALLNAAQVFATHDYALAQAQAHGLRFSATLLSNGTVMTTRMIAQLQARGIRLTLSLDGVGELHDRQRPYLNGRLGTFALVERSISRLLAAGLRPSINVTVSRQNIAALPTLLQYMLERNLSFRLSYYRENDCSAALTELAFSDAQMIAGMRTALAALERSLPRRRVIDSFIDKGSMAGLHQHTCGMGQNYLVVNQRGGVARCQMELTRVVTTVRRADPLQEVRDVRGGMQSVSVDQKEGCRTCTWRYWCMGGCPFVTYRATGRNDRRSPYCAIYLALFPDLVRLEALRLLAYATPLVFAASLPSAIPA